MEIPKKQSGRPTIYKITGEKRFFPCRTSADGRRIRCGVWSWAKRNGIVVTCRAEPDGIMAYVVAPNE